MRKKLFKKALFAVFRNEKELDDAKLRLQNEGLPCEVCLFSTIHNQPPKDFFNHQRMLVGPGLLIGALVGLLSFLVFLFFYEFQLISSTSPVVAGFRQRPFLLTLTALFFIALGAAAGSVVGIGVPQKVLKRLNDYVSQGATLVSIQIQSSMDQEKIIAILKRAGAREISILHEGQTWKYVLSKNYSASSLT